MPAASRMTRIEISIAQTRPSLRTGLALQEPAIRLLDGTASPSRDHLPSAADDQTTPRRSRRLPLENPYQFSCQEPKSAQKADEAYASAAGMEKAVRPWRHSRTAFRQI